MALRSRGTGARDPPLGPLSGKGDDLRPMKVGPGRPVRRLERVRPSPPPPAARSRPTFRSMPESSLLWRCKERLQLADGPLDRFSIRSARSTPGRLLLPRLHLEKPAPLLSKFDRDIPRPRRRRREEDAERHRRGEERREDSAGHIRPERASLDPRRDAAAESRAAPTEKRTVAATVRGRRRSDGDRPPFKDGNARRERNSAPPPAADRPRRGGIGNRRRRRAGERPAAREHPAREKREITRESDRARPLLETATRKNPARKAPKIPQPPGTRDGRRAASGEATPPPEPGRRGGRPGAEGRGRHRTGQPVGTETDLDVPRHRVPAARATRPAPGTPAGTPSTPPPDPGNRRSHRRRGATFPASPAARRKGPPAAAPRVAYRSARKRSALPTGTWKGTRSREAEKENRRSSPGRGAPGRRQRSKREAAAQPGSPFVQVPPPEPEGGTPGKGRRPPHCPPPEPRSGIVRSVRTTCSLPGRRGKSPGISRHGIPAPATTPSQNRTFGPRSSSAARHARTRSEIDSSATLHPNAPGNPTIPRSRSVRSFRSLSRTPPPARAERRKRSLTVRRASTIVCSGTWPQEARQARARAAFPR